MFPDEQQLFIQVQDVIECIIYEGRDEGCVANNTAAEFFVRYITEINQSQGGESIFYAEQYQ